LQASPISLVVTFNSLAIWKATAQGNFPSTSDSRIFFSKPAFMRISLENVNLLLMVDLTSFINYFNIYASSWRMVRKELKGGGIMSSKRGIFRGDPEHERDLFFNLINNLPVPVIVTNPDMSINHVNPAFEKLTGFSREEVAGAKAPYPWWPEEKREEYLTELKAIVGGKKHKSEWLFRTRVGQDFWITPSVSIVKENGEPQYLLAVWFDITGYK
jgi:PAS domain S-box-containing protein